jgi:hypothetical protein
MLILIVTACAGNEDGVSGTPPNPAPPQQPVPLLTPEFLAGTWTGTWYDPLVSAAFTHPFSITFSVDEQGRSVATPTPLTACPAVFGASDVAIQDRVIEPLTLYGEEITWTHNDGTHLVRFTGAWTREEFDGGVSRPVTAPTLSGSTSSFTPDCDVLFWTVRKES